MTNSRIYLLLNMAALSAFGPFVTDFYLPALPNMAGYFSTTTSLVQLSLTCSLAGLALGQLLMGPLSDKYGRKPILLISLLLFVLSTFACLLSWDIYSFILFRLLQGIAGSGGLVISKSVVADLFKGEELAKFFALLGAINGLVPICAPIIGGLVLEHTDWHGVFVILLGIGILLNISIIFFKESLPKERRLKGTLLESFTFFSILKNRQFMLYVLIQGFGAGVLFSFISSSSFLFQEHFNLSKIEYSFCFALAAFGTIVGASSVPLFKSPKLALKVGIYGLGIMGVIVCAMLAFKAPLFAMEAGFVLLLLCFGILIPPTNALAMELERDNAGNASAILGFATFSFGGLVSPLTGLGSDMLLSTSIVIAVCFICAVVLGRRALGRLES